jgi:hypothetical protein
MVTHSTHNMCGEFNTASYRGQDRTRRLTASTASMLAGGVHMPSSLSAASDVKGENGGYCLRHQRNPPYASLFAETVHRISTSYTASIAAETMPVQSRASAAGWTTLLQYPWWQREYRRHLRRERGRDTTRGFPQNLTTSSVVAEPLRTPSSASQAPSSRRQYTGFPRILPNPWRQQ